MLKVTLDTTDLDSRLKRIEGFVERDAIPVAAIVAAARIRQNTAKGVDADNKTFKPYTPAYAKIRAKLGLGVSPPNLTRSGDMLREMALFDNNTLNVSAEQRPKAEGNMRYRAFLAAGKEMLSDIEKALTDKLSRL